MATNAIAVPAPSGLTFGYYANLFRKEVQYEFVKMLRTKAFSLSVIGFPVMFYLLVGTSNRHNMFARYVLPSYSCMGVVSACLFGIGMGIAMERAYGWLELKQASPMPRLAYLGAKVITCAAFGLMIVAVLVTLGITLGGVSLTALEALKLAWSDSGGAHPLHGDGTAGGVAGSTQLRPGHHQSDLSAYVVRVGVLDAGDLSAALAEGDHPSAAHVPPGADRPEHLRLLPGRQHVDPLGGAGRIYPVDDGRGVDDLHPQ